MTPTEDRPPSPDLPPPAEIPGGDSAVRRINPLEDPSWDAGLAGWPAASFFHRSAWARVLHDTYGFIPVYFALESRDRGMGLPTHDLSVHGSGDPCHAERASPFPKAAEDRSPESRLLPGSPRFHALLPVMEVDSWLTGRRGVALPFTDECEPLCRDADSFRRLFGEALEYARVRAWKYLEFRGGKACFSDVPASTSFYGHRLDLRTGEKALSAGIEGAGRRALRKAEQSGLSVEFSQSPESIRAFHGLLCRTRKRHGVPPQPFVFFANIQRHVLAQNQGWVVLARHGGVAVAGAVFFHSGTMALYKFGASDEKYQNLSVWKAAPRSPS